MPPRSHYLLSGLVINTALVERKLLLKVQQACAGRCTLAGGFSAWLVAQDEAANSTWAERSSVKPRRFGDLDLFFDAGACRNNEECEALLERITRMAGDFLRDVWGCSDPSHDEAGDPLPLDQLSIDVTMADSESYITAHQTAYQEVFSDETLLASARSLRSDLVRALGQTAEYGSPKS